MAKREHKNFKWITRDDLRKYCCSSPAIHVNDGDIDDTYSIITIHYGEYFLGKFLENRKTNMILPLRCFRWTLETFKEIEIGVNKLGAIINNETKEEYSLEEVDYIQHIEPRFKEVPSMNLDDCINFDALPPNKRSNMLRQYNKGLEKFNRTFSQSVCALSLYDGYKELSSLFNTSTKNRRKLLATYENLILNSFRIAKKLCDSNINDDLLDLYINPCIFLSSKNLTKEELVELEKLYISLENNQVSCVVTAQS